jgi:hypothetical protein
MRRFLLSSSTSLICLLWAAPPCLARQDARYLVPKDVLAVDVVVTTTSATRLVDDGGVLKPEQTTTVKREATATLMAVGDPAQPVNIHLRNSGLSDTSFALEFAPNGLLTSINASSHGRLGDIIGSVFKFAGTVLSFLRPGFAAVDTACSRPAPASPAELRFFVQSNTRGCELWVALGRAETHLATQEAALASLQDQIPAARPDQIRDLTARIALQRAAVRDAKTSLSQRQDALAAELEKFLKSEGIGAGEPKVQRSRFLLELSDLPPDETVTDGMSIADVTTRLAGHPKALDLFKRGGVVATLGATKFSSTPAAPADDATGKTVTVCHRPATPLRLRLFVQARVRGGAEQIQQSVDAIENVLHPYVPAACTTFKASSLGDRKLALTMDEKGRLKRVERSGTSDAAALTASLATASAALRDEYAASLKKVEEIQTTSRNIRLADLGTEAERLKKEKAVIDAKLELEAGSINYETVLSQRKLAADLAALQADVNLATAEDTRDQRQEIERLKVEIEVLQKSLDLLRAEQELIKAKK